jgi:hypothetical protein
MLLEKMSKQEVIELLKPYLLKCNKDIDLKEVQFSKGHCYLFEQNEGGNWLKDNNNNTFDLCELKEEYGIDVNNVFEKYKEVIK